MCLNVLRARRAHPEEPLDADVPTRSARAAGVDPERQAILADSVGLALLVVLETLAPAERVAFVLHDMFGIPFDEIAPIVRAPDGRPPTGESRATPRAPSGRGPGVEPACAAAGGRRLLRRRARRPSSRR